LDSSFNEDHYIIQYLISQNYLKSSLEILDDDNLANVLNLIICGHGYRKSPTIRTETGSKSINELIASLSNSNSRVIFILACYSDDIDISTLEKNKFKYLLKFNDELSPTSSCLLIYSWDLEFRRARNIDSIIDSCSLILQLSSSNFENMEILK
jgi:hypothetical protein